ncbi:putative immunity/bacteriocin fusion bifunctional protein [Bacillus anthracis]|uniref:putative immunity/bacteriocin fusion bifunctional protein n=1 Tax=Bacillus cereus group TaxID=86661 RepID=UPI001F56F731|nr:MULTISPECIES: putative immunity/bacteriocin fusion bifunctional protein [Bacillus cereus group]MEB9505264.1 putative immunity/bacteriocin fusion bifunctional protein [Bacillus anthracis]
MLRKLSLLVTVLCLFLTSGAFGFSSNAKAETNIENANVVKQKALSPSEKESYLQLVEGSDLYKNKVSQKSIDKKSAAKLFTKENEKDFPEGVIIINGTPDKNTNLAFDAYVDVATKKIFKLTSYKISGKKANSKFEVKDYDGLGNLIAESNGTFGDFVTNKETIQMEQVTNINLTETKSLTADTASAPAAASGVDSKYIKWACTFASYVACATAAGACGPAAWACGLACRLAFQHFACKNV